MMSTKKVIQRIFYVLIVLTLFSGSGWLQPSPARADGTVVNDTPTPIVPSGVTEYTMTSPKIFWYTGVPQCPPAITGNQSSPDQPNYLETINRIATYGSPVRTLYSVNQNCNQGQILSNIVADNDFLYWLGPIGLMKLSTDANPGDAPQIVNALVNAPGELVDGGDRIYAINNNTGGSNTEVSYVWKSNNQYVHLSYPGNYAGNLAYDGQYVYYTVGSSLIRVDPTTVSFKTLTTGVTGFYAEGSRLQFCTINPFQCFYSNNVYIGKGRYVYIYNNNAETLASTPTYTSADMTASVQSIVTDFSKLFVFESRTIPCNPQPCFPSYSYVLSRTGRGGGAVDSLYTYGPTVYSGPADLKTDGSFLFWHEEDKVQRLPNDAAALPQVDMYVTGMEVTQGIQDLNNSVLLIKNRRTFVRVYVKSAGSSVSGVTAQLSAPALRLGPIQPINPVGTKITVRANPNRTDINQSYLFELPWSWTQNSNLNLEVTLNPYKVPLEPNYANNTASTTVSFVNSPSLSVEFLRLNFTLNGTTYRPRISADVLKTYSWILRAYPLGGAVGDKFKPRLWDVDGGTQLGNWVNRSSPDCKAAYPNAKDDVSLCASYYTNGWLFYYRIATQFGILNVGLKTDAFYYGMISDASNNFPRGQAMYTKTSVGPAGTPGQYFNLGSGWDTDGSYADWYAAHEIGHSLGRSHPNSGSDNPNTSNVTENCGHSRSDPNYPYGNTSTASAPIGPANGNIEGFDGGDPAFNIAPAVLPSNIWNDVMSYCSNQWISDYTYTGMYNYMLAHPSLAAAGANLPHAGDFLAISGVINPLANTAGFAFIRRLDNVVNVPALVPGDYSIRLLDDSGTVLAEDAFTPSPDTDITTLSFGQVVDFISGTRNVQIIKNSDGTVLASLPVSPNPPSVSNVAIQGAPNPVDGVVTLGWSASDTDNDNLVFDVAYSRDNGATFQPVAINISGNSTQIDTATLGGSGTAILRVTASDGMNSASSDSPPFILANKAPDVYILSPGTSTQIHYGQLVNFSGLALDAQDGTVADSGLAWKNDQGTILGTGALLSLDDLPVGSNGNHPAGYQQCRCDGQRQCDGDSR